VDLIAINSVVHHQNAPSAELTTPSSLIAKTDGGSAQALTLNSVAAAVFGTMAGLMFFLISLADYLEQHPLNKIKILKPLLLP